jgi:hypothetical protein
MNLIDGLDGLAAGIAAMACGVMAGLAVWQGNVILAVVMLALLGSLTGFLLFNFHPARIFMGDCGSLFLGFTIATASVMTAAKSEALVGLGLPILVLGIPILDTLLSIVRRVLHRRGISSPDQAHFHHVLLSKGLRHQHVVMMAYGATLLITGLGLFMFIANSTQSVLVFLGCLILLMLIFRFAGAVHIRDTLADIRKRSDLARRQRMDRLSFEAAELQFRNAQTFDQWWHCLCMAAKALDFARMSLEMASRDNGPRFLTWKKEIGGVAIEESQDVLEVKVPLRDRHQGRPHEILIRIPANGSLESAGRRVTLFTRLADEHGLDSLPAEPVASDGGKRDALSEVR